jgi:hypothetical protein
MKRKFPRPRSSRTLSNCTLGKTVKCNHHPTVLSEKVTEMCGSSVRVIKLNWPTVTDCFVKLHEVTYDWKTGNPEPIRNMDEKGCSSSSQQSVYDKCISWNMINVFHGICI